MEINRRIYTPNFGRAFTTKESEAYSRLLKDTREKLGIEDTSAIIFDFNIPSKSGENTAIGSTWSGSMQDFIKFVKKMTGINSIQLAPQGKISQVNRSPYSGTTFAYGEHLIDLSKLTNEEYGELLDIEYIKSLDKNYPNDKNIREYKTDYKYTLENQAKALKTAFENFQKGLSEQNPNITKLNTEFEQFKEANNNWLDKEALFTALTKHYQTSDFNRWSETDKNLYSSNIDENTRQNRIKEIKSEYSDIIEYEKFIQFIADKQQKASHIFLDSENIKLYGDCLIGFSQSEMWGNKECFRENLYYGGPDPNCTETNEIQAWGLPALDYRKLGECNEDGDLSKLGVVGKLLYNKFSEFFKRYDGIRVDAAWQFVTPFIYQAINGKYEEVKMPEISNTVFNIIKAAANNSNIKADDINDRVMLELVGFCADKSRAMTKNIYPHLYTTAYAEYDERPKKFLEKGYINGKFYTGTGNHDNDSLVNMARDTQRSEMHYNNIKGDFGFDDSILNFQDTGYKNQSDEERRQERFKTAKVAEVFTAAKQFFTLPDMFGMSERINISGKQSENNWSVRIPSDYERFYFSQLSNGYGINIPKVLASAMSMKHMSDCTNLIQKCNEAAEILRQKGPNTEQEANTWEKDGKLNTKFEYIQ